MEYKGGLQTSPSHQLNMKIRHSHRHCCRPVKVGVQRDNHTKQESQMTNCTCWDVIPTELPRPLLVKYSSVPECSGFFHCCYCIINLSQAPIKSNSSCATLCLWNTSVASLWITMTISNNVMKWINLTINKTTASYLHFTSWPLSNAIGQNWTVLWKIKWKHMANLFILYIKGSNVL